MALQNRTFDQLITFNRDSGATRVNAAGLIVGVDFSVTSVTFGTGAKTFTLAADANVNRDWPVGSKVRATSQAAPLGLMNGTVTSYNAATQQLVINVTENTGTGTSTDWRIGSLEFRRDFDPATLEPKGGLVEGGATNLITQSTDFSAAYWQKSANCVFEHGLPFFGTSWATKVTPQIGQTTGADHIWRSATVTNISLLRHNKIFVKSDGVRYISLTYLSSFTANPQISAVYDLQAGTAVANDIFATGGGLVASQIANIRPFSDGWWEISINSSRNTPGYDQFRVGAASALNINNVSTFAGNGVDGYLIALPHAENKGYKTQSAIPTKGVSITRATDLPNIGGSSFSQIFNPLQGTLLIEMTPVAVNTADSSIAVSINDGTLNNAIRAGMKQSGATSSIRAIASDGVTDVMGVDAATNTLRSNGVDYTPIATGVLTNARAVASSSANNFLIGGNLGRYSQTTNGGLTYTKFQMGANDQAQINGAAFGNGTYVVVGNAVNGSGLIATVDPTTFAYQRRASGVNGTFGSVRFLNGAFYATISLAVVRTILRSVDGITWSVITVAGATAEGYRDITLGNSVYVAVGSGGSIATSSDGLSFSRFPSGATTQILEGVNFANGLFVAVGNAGTIITSPNGTEWTLRTSGTTNALYAVHYSIRDKQWYAAGDNGIILRSPDAITWENINNDAVGAVTRDGLVQSSPILPNLVPNQINTIAMRFKENDFGVSVNGSPVATDSNGSIPMVDRLSIGAAGDGSRPFNGHIRKIRYFPYALTDEELTA